jgi:hypothetical protein
VDLGRDRADTSGMNPHHDTHDAASRALREADRNKRELRHAASKARWAAAQQRSFRFFLVGLLVVAAASVVALIVKVLA